MIFLIHTLTRYLKILTGETAPGPIDRYESTEGTIVDDLHGGIAIIRFAVVKLTINSLKHLAGYDRLMVPTLIDLSTFSPVLPGLVGLEIRGVGLSGQHISTVSFVP